MLDPGMAVPLQEWQRYLRLKSWREYIADKPLEVQGVAPGKNTEGITRLVYENVNGLQNRIGGNEKLQKFKDLVDELEVDLVAINEHKIRLGHKLNRNGLSQRFNGGETEIRSVMGGNTHEKGGSKVQQGGTGLLLYGGLIDQYDFKASGKDATGLGRWIHMALRIYQDHGQALWTKIHY